METENDKITRLRRAIIHFKSGTHRNFWSSAFDDQVDHAGASLQLKAMVNNRKLMRRKGTESASQCVDNFPETPHSGSARLIADEPTATVA